MGLLSISLSMLNVSISWPLIRITKKKRPEMKSTLKMKSHEESSRIGKEKTQPIRSLKLWSPTQSTQDTHRLDLGMVPRVGLGDNAPFQIWKAIRQQTSFMLQCWDLFFGIVHKVPAVIEAGNSFTINNLCRRLEASGRRKAWRSTTNESLLNRWSMVHETEIDSLNLWTSCPSTRPKGWIDSVISLRKHESNQEYASPILRFFMAGRKVNKDRDQKRRYNRFMLHLLNGSLISCQAWTCDRALIFMTHFPDLSNEFQRTGRKGDHVNSTQLPDGIRHHSLEVDSIWRCCQSCGSFSASDSISLFLSSFMFFCYLRENEKEITTTISLPFINQSIFKDQKKDW